MTLIGKNRQFFSYAISQFTLFEAVGLFGLMMASLFLFA